MRAILQASALVFAELGYAGATTNKIAARAGVSIGSLYQYFPNKAALMRALRERHHREVHAILEAAERRLHDPSIPLPESLRDLLESLVELHAQDPALHRALAEDIPNLGGSGREKAEETRRWAHSVEALLRARPEVAVPDPPLSALLFTRTIESLTRWLGHEAPEDLDRSACVDEILVMLLGYLHRSG